MLTYGAIPPSTGAKYEFYVNAGTVIGGCSIYGGRGTIVGSLIGTAVMTIVQFSLRSLNIEPGYQNTVLGAILMFAILIDTIKEKKKM
jgi:ribose transport system permease protein